MPADTGERVRRRSRRGSFSPRRSPSGASTPGDAQLGPLRRALFRRVARQVRDSLRSMGLQDLAALAELETPVETIARLVSMRPTVGLGEVDDYSLRLLRGAQRKQELLESLGGVLSSGEAAAVLGITVPAVKQRVRRRTLLAVPMANGEWGFPSAQFGESGGVREGLPEVLSAFGGHEDPWAMVMILSAPDPVSDEGTTLEHLENERTRRIAIQRARSYGVQGAS